MTVLFTCRLALPAAAVYVQLDLLHLRERPRGPARREDPVPAGAPALVSASQAGRPGHAKHCWGSGSILYLERTAFGTARAWNEENFARSSCSSFSTWGRQSESRLACCAYTAMLDPRRKMPLLTCASHVARDISCRSSLSSWNGATSVSLLCDICPAPDPHDADDPLRLRSPSAYAAHRHPKLAVV